MNIQQLKAPLASDQWRHWAECETLFDRQTKSLWPLAQRLSFFKQVMTSSQLWGFEDESGELRALLMSQDDPWCRTFFGFPVERIRYAWGEGLSDLLAGYFEQKQAAGVALVYGRMSAQDAAAKEAIQHNLGQVVETLVNMQRTLCEEDAQLEDDRVVVLSDHDLPSVQRLVRCAYQESHFHLSQKLDVSSCDAMYASLMQQWMSHGDVVFHAYRDEKMLQAFCAHSPGFVHFIAVDPLLQGRGFASRLLGHVLAWQATHGVTTMELNTHSHNPKAQKLYQQHGFKPDFQQMTWHRWLS